MSQETKETMVKILQAISLADDAIRLNEEKTKLLNELRRTLAHKALQQGVLSRYAKRGEPCPICNVKRGSASYDGGNCMSCKHYFGYPPVKP